MQSSICIKLELAEVLKLKGQVDSFIVIIIIILSHSTSKSISSQGDYH
jgi:hypothetical protein